MYFHCERVVRSSADGRPTQNVVLLSVDGRPMKNKIVIGMIGDRYVFIHVYESAIVRPTLKILISRS